MHLLVAAASLLLAAMPQCTAVVSPNTSLATLPVSYFGGVSLDVLPDDYIAMLAKQRIVTVEKWMGPCFDDCGKNQSMGLPCSSGCRGEYRMLDVIHRIKTANPAVACGFYMNSLYDWTFQELDAQFAAADENMRASNGSVITMVQDNGLTGQHVFDLSQPAAVKRWLQWQHTLLDTGEVDGIFLDKPQILAFVNQTTGKWNMCESGPSGAGNEHPWRQRCAPIKQSVGEGYNTNKVAMLASLRTLWYKAGFVLSYARSGGGFFGNSYYFTGLRRQRVPTLLATLDAAFADADLQYVRVSLGDQHTTSTSPASFAGECTVNDVAKFLVVVREGMFLGCNGWNDTFGRPLGDPLGAAERTGHVYTRRFAAGTSVTYDDETGRGTVFWA